MTITTKIEEEVWKKIKEDDRFETWRCERYGEVLILKSLKATIATLAQREERERMEQHHRKQIAIQDHFLTEYEHAPFEWHKGRKIEAEEALEFLLTNTTEV